MSLVRTLWGSISDVTELWRYRLAVPISPDAKPSRLLLQLATGSNAGMKSIEDQHSAVIASHSHLRVIVDSTYSHGLQISIADTRNSQRLSNLMVVKEKKRR